MNSIVELETTLTSQMSCQIVIWILEFWMVEVYTQELYQISNASFRLQICQDFFLPNLNNFLQ